MTEYEASLLASARKRIFHARVRRIDEGITKAEAQLDELRATLAALTAEINNLTDD